MRREDSEGRHRVDAEGFGDRSRERLGEERDATSGFGSGREKLGLQTLVVLRDEEHGGSKCALAVLFTRNLVVQEALDVVDREKVLAVHRDDDGVPHLRDENLGLVLDLHVGSREDLGVDPLRKTFENV